MINAMPKTSGVNAKKKFIKVADTVNVKSNKNKVIWAILLVVIIVAGLTSFYFYREYTKAQSLLQNPSASAVAEGKALVATVGKLIELPNNEDPTIATVSDATKLTDQQFFSRAQNGDKVLVYKLSKMLILFRPGLNKIINIATLNTVNVPQAGTNTVQSPSSSGSPVPSPTVAKPTVSIAVYNGTAVSGLAKTAETKIKSSNVVSISSSTTADAKNGVYSNTLVIDVSGNQSQAAQLIATLLNAKVSNVVPQGEVKPTNADIIIIVGTDFSK
jgi:hypothetical protein